MRSGLGGNVRAWCMRVQDATVDADDDVLRNAESGDVEVDPFCPEGGWRPGWESGWSRRSDHLDYNAEVDDSESRSE